MTARAQAAHLASAAFSALPDPVVHRSAAWSFRLRREQRMLFLDDLVDPRRNAVDIGAWWGPWTYWLSRRCPEVWAFEPNPQLARALRRCVRPNVHVEEVALSDRTGTEHLYVPRSLGPDAQATLEAEHRLDDADEVAVAVRSLDDYDLADVGFMKIDVEAHEEAVLHGAIETLRRERPVVLIELEQRFHDTPITRVFDWFGTEGFAGWMRRSGQWVSVGGFDVERDQLAHVANPKSVEYINNFVFTPDGRAPSR